MGSGGNRLSRLSQLPCWFKMITVTKSDNSRFIWLWAKSWWFYLICICSSETLLKLMWIWLMIGLSGASGWMYFKNFGGFGGVAVFLHMQNKKMSTHSFASHTSWGVLSCFESLCRINTPLSLSRTTANYLLWVK